MKNFTIIFYVLSLSVSILLNRNADAQNATASLENMSACPGSEILVAINITDFYDVCAISLFIGYDTSMLHFESLENINPQLPGINANAMTSPVPQVGITWSNLNPANISEGTLADLRFTYFGGISPLTFNPGGEIVKSNLQVLDVTFFDGSVTPLIQIIEQPHDTTVHEPQGAAFSISVDGGILFQWQLSNNGGATFNDLNNSGLYQGVYTNTLFINSTNLFMDGFLYRCLIANGDCEEYSEQAKLSVLPELHFLSVELPAGWSGLSFYLEPLNNKLPELFKDILDSMVILVDDSNNYFYPLYGINTIGTWDSHKGYAVKMDTPVILNISGYLLSDKSIILEEGWNYLPVLCSTNIDINNLPSSFLEKLEIAKEIAGWETYWPDKSVFSLQTLITGKAYMVKMTEQTTLVFP